MPPKETHKTTINIPIGTIVGNNTKGTFQVIDILSKPETDRFWETEFNKKAPHDQAYHIQFKCGKTYWTLKTQVWKCMHPNDVGWRTCYNCTKNKNESCRWDQQMSHSISVKPIRNVELPLNQIYGDLKLIDFAFNAKRHNYYEFECLKCGTHCFHMTPTNKSDIESACHCKACEDIRYRGPATIKKFLDKYKIPYEKEYRFDKCVYQKQLPFDFAVFYPTGELKCVIEYDGEQHFHFVQYFHGDEEGFKLQQLRDNIKTQYCKQNNIKLIRIPYTEYDNIEQILKANLII